VIEAQPKPDYRTGIGTDIHRLVPERALMLGGVHIPFPAGLLGHSDGDVALHAVIDALLGAAGLGDIGTLFPSSDPAYKDADSKGLLLAVRELLQEKRWEIVNIDLIIHLEEPRLEPFKGQIKRCIASLLSMDFGCVNVKAKTNEGLGEIGRCEAMGATATALLRQTKRRGLQYK
jgi:2-C-methyl-D-erythritol 2,4-cyclodiphosphate synthase